MTRWARSALGHVSATPLPHFRIHRLPRGGTCVSSTGFAALPLLLTILVTRDPTFFGFLNGTNQTFYFQPPHRRLPRYGTGSVLTPRVEATQFR